MTLIADYHTRFVLRVFQYYCTTVPIYVSTAAIVAFILGSIRAILPASDWSPCCATASLIESHCVALSIRILVICYLQQVSIDNEKTLFFFLGRMGCWDAPCTRTVVRRFNI